MADLLDTSRARAAILERVRKAQGRAPAPGTDDAARRQAAEDYIARHSLAPKPTLGPDLVDHFEAQAQRMASTTDRVATMDAVPGAVARFLTSNGLSGKGVRWPALDGCDWAAAGLALEPRAPNGDDLLGVTGVFAAIAETGTLMMLSGPDSPASTHLLPETHVAVVPASRIVGHYEDAFAWVRSERGQTPRAMNLVSGPSRTGDIEQTIVLGAHGPYRVHIVIVEGA